MSTILKTTQMQHGATALDVALDAKLAAVAVFSTTWDPPSIAAGGTYSQAFTVPQALFGDFVDTSFTQPLSGCLVTSAVSAAGQVTVTLLNPTGSTVNLASGTLKLRLTR